MLFLSKKQYYTLFYLFMIDYFKLSMYNHYQVPIKGAMSNDTD